MATNNTGVDFDADVAEATNDILDSMTFDGTAYAAAIGTISSDIEIEGIQGPTEDIAFVIVVRTTLLPATRPVTGDQVTIGSTVYRIAHVETDEADTALNIYVKEFTS